MVHFNLITREFLKYRFLNSFFVGLSSGVYFTIYTPLSPSIFSLGGIALAIGLLVVAKLYAKILNIDTFFKISLMIEAVMLLMIGYFLLFSYSFSSALLVYLGYQFTFVFGSYIVRAETLFLKRSALLSFLDVAKQKGYLLGLVLSYIFYEMAQYATFIENTTQVYYIHYLLFINQILVIYYLLNSFKSNKLR